MESEKRKKARIKFSTVVFEATMETDNESAEAAMGFVSRIFNEIVTSPLNLALLGAIGYVVYRIFSTQMEDRKVKTVEPPLPKVCLYRPWLQ